jgi:hypothetical protein
VAKAQSYIEKTRTHIYEAYNALVPDEQLTNASVQMAIYPCNKSETNNGYRKHIDAFKNEKVLENN